MALSDNKRIAMNSAILYAKLILSTLIGLYASRLVLQALGVSDYGIYTVVGGVVAMMNFLGTTMVSVTNRYIVVEMGKGESGDCNKVFNTTLAIHIFLALLILVLGETIGVYYVENILHVPEGKTADALFVLHASIAACILNVLYVPYNGLIMAREKFLFTSCVEIARTLVKLALVIWLVTYMGNRLKAFSLIVVLFSALLPISMYLYCYVKDRQIIRWNFNRCWSDYTDIFKFTFWMMIGALASIGQSQGANMVVNLFFSTAVNAAYGIANQVNSYVMMFVKSFNQAAIPQIMKNQENNAERSINLVYATTRYSFFILLLPAFPLLLNMNHVLILWLGKAPIYTSSFASLLLVCSLIRCLGAGFDAIIQATGKVKLNQIVYSVAYLAVLPAAYFLYKAGFPVDTVNVLIIIAAIIVLVFQTFYLSRITDLTIMGYVRKTLLPVLGVTLALLPAMYLDSLLPDDNRGFLLSLCLSAVWVILTVYCVGMKKEERERMNSLVKKLVKKI